MPRPVVSVIIVNWNGERLLGGCLAALSAQRYRNFETIVVDNGSVDGSVKLLRDSYPGVAVIENGENRGFAAANNQAIAIAKGRYLALLNNDVEVGREWLSHFVAAAESSPPDVGMWACKILSWEDRATIDSVGGLLLSRCGIAKGRGRGAPDRGQYDREREVFIPSACAALYRRELFQDIGGFDEDFFAYCEDTDLGMRARLRGWKCLSVPDAVVFHHYSGTAGKYSPMKAFLVERNHLWVALKTFPLPMLLRLPPVTLWRCLLQAYGIATRQGAGGQYVREHSKASLIGLLLKAWLAAAKRAPRMIRKRRRIGGCKTVSDREQRRWFTRYGIGISELVLKV